MTDSRTGAAPVIIRRTALCRERIRRTRRGQGPPCSRPVHAPGRSFSPGIVQRARLGLWCQPIWISFAAILIITSTTTLPL